MLRKFTASAIFMALISTAYSQDSTKTGTLTISGSVDAYYRFNFQNAKDSMRTNNYTSFTNTQNSFELGMASLKADYSIGKVAATLDLGFGKRAEEFSYNEAGTALTAIKQAYVSYAPSEHVKFSMGKWGTHVGYELLDAYLNRNYSMDYMFSYGPFFHTGLKADFTFGNCGLMLGVTNPPDNLSASFAKKFFIGQFSAASKSGKVKGYLNYLGGKDGGDNSINQIDVVGLFTVSDKFNIGYNGTIQTIKPSGGDGDSWWGSALYLNFDPTPAFGLTARGEYFDNKKAVSAAPATSIFDFTLSGNIRIDNLTIIPEFRVDSGKDPIFFKNSDTGSPTAKGTGTFILAATYHF
ncbi:MAG: outer membrane beta-barrel protein [Bacteroidota bacterium]